MKTKLLFLFATCLVAALLLVGCSLPAFAAGKTGALKGLSIVDISGILVGAYEVVVRAFPTVKNYSVVDKVINVLRWLSGSLNAKKVK